MSLRGLRLVVATVLGGACAGCSDPLERRVPAATAGRFSAWRAQLESDSSVVLRERAAAALREIRQDVAGARELQRRRGEPVEMGTGAIDDAVRERVNGRRLREVLQMGLELRVDRLKAELAGLAEAMDKNAELLTRPGDTEARRILDELRARQMTRLKHYRDDLAAAERDLAPLQRAWGRLLPERLAAELPERG